MRANAVGVTKGKSEIYKKEESRGMRRRRWKTGWNGLESELGRHTKSLIALLEWPSTYALLLCLPGCYCWYYLLPLALIRFLGKNDRIVDVFSNPLLCYLSFFPVLSFRLRSIRSDE
jgi:hypothetical protein